MAQILGLPKLSPTMEEGVLAKWIKHEGDSVKPCLLYTSDAADERSSVDLGGRRIIKKKNNNDDEGISLAT